MANDTTLTIIGNLVEDPSLRFTPAGAAVANLTIASTARKFNRDTNAWEDSSTLFLRCSVWREAAENVAESLQRGMRVIASGRLTMRSYETKEGEKRTVTELDIDEIGPSLKSASAKVTKTQRGQGTFGGATPAPATDPWAVQADQGKAQTSPGQQPGGWGQQQPSYDEPPFAVMPSVISGDRPSRF